MIRSRHMVCLVAVVALLGPAATSLAVQLHHALADHHAAVGVHGHSHAELSEHGHEAHEHAATDHGHAHEDAAEGAHEHPPALDHAPRHLPLHLPVQVADRHHHAGPTTLPGLAGERSTYRPHLERSVGPDSAGGSSVESRPSPPRQDFGAGVEPPLPTPALRLQDQRILLLI